MDWLIGFAVLWVVCCFPVYMIARRLGHGLPWAAFIPFVNVWLLCELADREWYWVIGLLFPIVGLLLLALLMMDIAKQMDQPEWIGGLVILPVVNLLMLYYLAFCPEQETLPDLLDDNQSPGDRP